MRSYLFFKNDNPLLEQLEDEDGFIEIDVDFDFLKNFQLDDMVTKTLISYTGEEIELHLIVDSRMFDLDNQEFSVQTLVGAPIEGNDNFGMGFGQSLN